MENKAINTDTEIDASDNKILQGLGSEVKPSGDGVDTKQNFISEATNDPASPKDDAEAIAFIESLEATSAGASSGHYNSFNPLIEESFEPIFPDTNTQTALEDDANTAPNSRTDIRESDELIFTASEQELILETSTLNLIEDFQISANGQANGPGYQAIENNETEYGSLSLSEDGNWQYSLNNELAEVQALGAGDRLTETFELVANDGSISQVEIWINGTNDRPNVSGQNRGELSEDGDSNQAHGQLIISDTDATEGNFTPSQNLEGAYGQGSIDSDGNWTYTVDNQSSAVQGLHEGQALTDYFFVSSADGTETRIAIEISGADDTPIFDGINFARLDPSNETSANGKLSVSDADFGESRFQADSDISTQFGTGNISEDGHWSYTLDPEHQETLEGLGYAVNDSFTIQSADGTSLTVIVKIDSKDVEAAIGEAPSEKSNDLSVEQALINFVSDSAQNETIDPVLGPYEEAPLTTDYTVHAASPAHDSLIHDLTEMSTGLL